MFERLEGPVGRDLVAREVPAGELWAARLRVVAVEAGLLVLHLAQGST